MSSTAARSPSGAAALAGAQACARESGIAVARIGDERLALGIKRRDQARLGDAEQRAQNTATVEFADRRHPGEAVGAAVRGAADQVGLGLIFAVMRGQQMQAAMLAAPLGEQSITRRPAPPPGFRSPAFSPPKPGLRGGFPGPTASRRAGGARRRSPAAAGGRRSARRSRRRRAAPSDPPESPAQGCRGRPRRRPRQTGRFQNRRAGRAQPRKLGDAQRLRGTSRAQHPSRFFSCAARSLMALPGCGNAWSSCISAMQALCFWLARSSDIPSFSRPSGAFGPFG